MPGISGKGGTSAGGRGGGDGIGGACTTTSPALSTLPVVLESAPGFLSGGRGILGPEGSSRM